MRISYSTLDTYRTCPLKYKFKAIDKIAEPKSKEQVFGTIVHSTLKFIHTPGALSPSLEQALDFFGKTWNSDLYPSEQEERAAFTQGVAMIQRYYKDNNISAATIVGLERPFQIPFVFEEETHLLSGVIDRIDRTENGFEIIDYKTARNMPTQARIESDMQLSIYLLAFLNFYPKEKENLKNITVSLYYLKHGMKLSATRTEEQLEEVKKTIGEIIIKMREGDYPPRVSPLCEWCAYQRICPMWKHKFKDERKFDSEEIQQRIEEFGTIRKNLIAEKKKLGELQKEIVEYMKQEKVSRLFAKEHIIGQVEKTTHSYDGERIREILKKSEMWSDVSKLDPGLLEKLLPSFPLDVKEEVEKTRTEKTFVTLSFKKNNSVLDAEEES